MLRDVKLMMVDVHTILFLPGLTEFEGHIMPFTFSHPAIVLPFISKNKSWKIFSSTGLIIGSIIPDFESFIRFDQHKEYSHTWLGAFWFDLPLAVLFAVVFHNVVRDPLIRNLPPTIGAKYYSYLNFNWNAFFRKHVVMVVYSMLIGIFSHLLWDAFTHLNLADPNAIDAPQMIGRFRLYIILQYACSVLGLSIVIWYILKDRKQFSAEAHIGVAITDKRRTQYWSIAAIIAAVTIFISIYLINELINPVWFIEIAISGVLVALILTPVLQRVMPDSGADDGRNRVG